MASIPHVQSRIAGEVLSPTAATAGPDTVRPSDSVTLIAQNNDSSSATVDVVVPGNTKWGQDQPDVTSVSIPAGELATIGPLPRDLANDQGNVEVTASSTSVNFYAVVV